MVAECCCGEVKIEVQEKPFKHGVCHCKNCKKRTGSAFGISVYFKRDNVVGITGETYCYHLTSRYDGSKQERFFCKACGTTVYWHISTFPDLIGIAGGCFVEECFGKPGYSVSTKSKWSWIKLPYRMIKHA